MELLLQDILLRKISKFSDSHPPAVTLGIVPLNFFKVLRKNVEPNLFFFATGIFFYMANFEFRELSPWVKRLRQGN